MNERFFEIPENLYDKFETAIIGENVIITKKMIEKALEHEEHCNRIYFSKFKFNKRKFGQLTKKDKYTRRYKRRGKL